MEAADQNPFDALSSGDVRLAPRGGLETLRVGAAGRGTTAVGADGSYSLGGLSAGVPVRIFAVGSGEGAVLHSELRTLDAGNSYTAALDVEAANGPPAPVFDLEGSDPGSLRTLTLPAVGSTTKLVVSGKTATGEDYGITILGALESAAIATLSSDPGVATVSPVGDITAQGSGLALVSAFGDGEWAHVLVTVDLSVDSDSDGMPDSFEITYGLNPAADDSGLDADGDLLSNLEEFEAGTLPDDPDTDGDLLTDKEEIDLGTDPLELDTDGDSFNDFSEVVSSGTDPFDPNDNVGSGFTPVFKRDVSLSACCPTGIRAAAVNDVAFVLSSNGRIASYLINTGFFILWLDSLFLSNDVQDIAVVGDTAYVAAGAAGLHVVDVMTPANLQLTTTVTTGLGTVVAVAAREDAVFVWSAVFLKVFRRGPSGTLTSAGTLQILTGVNRVAVSGSLAFLGSPGFNTLYAVDVSDLDSPVLRDPFPMPAASLAGRFGGLVASAGFAYVAHGTAGLVAVSAVDPTDLQVIDTSAIRFPGNSFDAVSLLGNRLAAHTPAQNAEAQLFRISGDGTFEFDDDVGGNPNGAIQLMSNQNYVAGLSSQSLAVSQVRQSRDSGGTPPTGSLILESPGVIDPGEEISVRARATDDIYLEGVDFLINGQVVLRDSFPPYRLQFTTDPLILGPYDIVIRAVGVDLAQDEGTLGVALISVGEAGAGAGASAEDPEAVAPQLPQSLVSLESVEFSGPMVIRTPRVVSAVATMALLGRPVILNEILYQPLTESDEFIELSNRTEVDVALHDSSRGRGWQVRGLTVGDSVAGSRGAPFEFAAGTVIRASGYLLLVAVEPEVFRSRYQVPADVVIVGPYRGTLHDAGAHLELVAPALFADAVQVIVDRIRYSVDAPWPAAPAGEGLSLERVRPADGEDPASWRASLSVNGTPGVQNSRGGGILPGDCNVDGRFDFSDTVCLLAEVFQTRGQLPCGDGMLADPSNLTILDANDDGSVGLADVVYLFSHLFQGGPEPAAGSECARFEGCPEACAEE